MQGKPLKNFLQPASLLKILVFHNFFFKVFWQLYIKNISFLTNTKICLIMLTFMNSNLPDKLVVLISKTIFSKRVNPMKYSVKTYIGDDLEFIIHVFDWCIPLDHKIYTNCNKKHLTWLELYLVIISVLDLKVNKQKKPFINNSTKIFWFFSEFDRVTFDYSILWVFLIDKSNENCRNSKKFERNALSTTKKSFQKENNITPAKTNAPISQTS